MLTDVSTARCVHTGRPLNDTERRARAQLAQTGQVMHSRVFAMYVPVWDTSRQHGPSMTDLRLGHAATMSGQGF